MAYQTSVSPVKEDRDVYDKLYKGIQIDLASINEEINRLMTEDLKPYPYTAAMGDKYREISTNFARILIQHEAFESGVKAGKISARLIAKLGNADHPVKAMIDNVEVRIQDLQGFMTKCQKLLPSPAGSSSGAAGSRRNFVKSPKSPEGSARDMIEAAIKNVDSRLVASVETAQEMRTRAQDRLATLFFATTLRPEAAAGATEISKSFGS